MPPKKLNRADSSQQVPTSELQSIASKSSSPQSQLREAATLADSALSSQKHASSLRAAAATLQDPKKREQYLTAAYNKEIEAHGNSKKARVLTSGAFQGGVGGAGIGAATAAGLGTVVGTLVGTVTALPATAVGGLAGVATGAMHGPWIKLGKIGKKDDAKDGEGEDDAVPDPEALRQAAEKIEMEGNGVEGDGELKEKKKPRKLEVRSKQAA
jgi:hypothetical protein